MPRKTNDSVTATPRPRAPRKAATASESAPPAPRRHKKATPAATGSVEIVISREEIAALAYTYWEARGFQQGSPEEDWLRAEAELRSQTSAA